jgi:hypothetical protein
VSDGLAAAEDAEHEAAEHRDTPQKKAVRMDELEERAQIFGDSVKQSYTRHPPPAPSLDADACPMMVLISGPVLASPGSLAMVSSTRMSGRCARCGRRR